MRKDLTDKELAQLKEQHRNPVVNRSVIPEGVEHLDKWNEAGRPHLYAVVQETRNCVAAVDFGHGHLALFEDGVLVGTTSGSTIVNPRVAMLDPTYYGDPTFTTADYEAKWLYFS